MDFSNLSNPVAWLRLAVLLGAGAVVYFGALSLFTLRRLRHPRRRTYAWAVARNVPGDPSEIAPGPIAYESWSFSNDGLVFPVWDARGDDADGPVVVLSHGWGASRINMLSRAVAMRPHASRLLLWDMRGHGEAAGGCTLGAREPRDLLALIERAMDGRSGRPFVLYGYSLGAEVTLRTIPMLPASTRGSLGGVALEAPYARGITPARAMLEEMGFPRVVNLPVAMALHALLERRSPADRWRDLVPLAAPLRDAGTRTLVLHGGDDRISPIDDARRIADASGGTLVEIPGAGHSDLFGDDGQVRPALADGIARFFASLRRDERA